MSSQSLTDSSKTAESFEVGMYGAISLGKLTSRFQENKIYGKRDY